MSTLSHEQTTTEQDVESLVSRLQDNMRLYDLLTSEISAIRFETMSADEALEGVDLEEALYQQNTVIAFAALNKLIIDKKTADLNRRRQELEYSPSTLITLLNRGNEFRMRSLDPGQSRISTFWLEDGRATSFSGKFSDEISGSLYEIGLKASDGGYVKLANKKRTRMYQARPLFDRKNEYTPLFEIKLL